MTAIRITTILVCFGLIALGCSDDTRDAKGDAHADAGSDTLDSASPFDVDTDQLLESLPERRRNLGKIRVDGTYAYTLAFGLENRVDYRLLVYDVSSEQPALVGKALVENQPTDITIHNGVAYLVTNHIGAGTPAIHAYDLSNPTAPRLTASVPLDAVGPDGQSCLDEQLWPELQLDAFGDRVVVGCAFGLLSVDISAPNSPVIERAFDLGKMAFEVTGFEREKNGDKQHLVIPFLDGDRDVSIFELGEDLTRKDEAPIALSLTPSPGARTDMYIPADYGEATFTRLRVAAAVRGGAVALSEISVDEATDTYQPSTYTSNDITFDAPLSGIGVYLNEVYVAQQAAQDGSTPPSVSRISFTPLRDPSLEGTSSLDGATAVNDVFVTEEYVFVAVEVEAGDGVIRIPRSSL